MVGKLHAGFWLRRGGLQRTRTSGAYAKYPSLYLPHSHFLCSSHSPLEPVSAPDYPYPESLTPLNFLHYLHHPGHSLCSQYVHFTVLDIETRVCI